MSEISRKIDVQKLISYSDDLVQFLKNEKDINDLKYCVEKSDALRSRCRSDHAAVQSSLEDYQKKIDLCKQKTEAAKAEVASDAEINLLQKELDDELQRESLLQEELRAITNEVKDLEEQRSLIEERRKVLMILKQDDLNAQLKLSMFACVTKIIPDLNDQSKMISGNIVDKEKKAVEKFELNPQEMSDFDTCNTIWNMVEKAHSVDLQITLVNVLVQPRNLHPVYCSVTLDIVTTRIWDAIFH